MDFETQLAPQPRLGLTSASKRRVSLSSCQEPFHAVAARNDLSWRNRRNSWLSNLACIFMITVPPVLTVLGWIAFEYFGGSLLYVLRELHRVGLLDFFKHYGPAPNGRVAVAYFCWVLFQALLYTVLPGTSTGQLTAGGELLHYNTNGLSAWVITVSSFTLLSLNGTVDPSIIARNWGSLIIVFNCYGYILSVIAYVKAYYAPSHSRDRNFSGKLTFLPPMIAQN
jgi:7-dehydrocholesterol reductase